MSFLNNLRSRLPVDRYAHLLLILAILLLIAVTYLILTDSFSRRPQRTSQGVASRPASPEGQLLAAPRAQVEESDRSKEQVTTDQTEVDATADLVLNESQAAEILEKIFQYAHETRVEIIDLQAQIGATAQEVDFLDTRGFQFQVQGALPRLASFVSRVREAAGKSIMITGVNTVEGTEHQILTVEVALNISPNIVEPSSMPPLNTASEAHAAHLTQLTDALTLAWESADWHRALGLINQILVIDPDHDGMVDRLFTAHVNFGYQLLDESNASRALTHFNAALEIKPDEEIALTGLKFALATRVPSEAPASQSPYTTYVVEPGDTLFSISLRYDTTVQAIMDANGLADHTIWIGQQLLVPIDP